jgi:histidine phosphotransferase ChpT
MQTAVVRAVEPPPFAAGYQKPTAPSTVDIRVLELLAARLCHELSGPIAAINNGVELLTEEDSGLGSASGTAFVRDAAALVSDSARRARSRLQFYRFAYGFSSGSEIAGPAPHEVASGFLAATRIVGNYADGIRILSPDWQKLACNLLSVGADLLPRGGRLVLADDPLTLDAVGEPAALSPEAYTALILATPTGELTPRTVQPYFTGLLAKALGGSLIATSEPGRVRIRVMLPNNARSDGLRC